MEDRQVGKNCRGSAEDKPREEVNGKWGGGNPAGAYAATAVADDMPVTPPPPFAAALMFFL